MKTTSHRDGRDARREKETTPSRVSSARTHHAPTTDATRFSSGESPSRPDSTGTHHAPAMGDRWPTETSYTTGFGSGGPGQSTAESTDNKALEAEYLEAKKAWESEKTKSQTTQNWQGVLKAKKAMEAASKKMGAARKYR